MLKFDTLMQHLCCIPSTLGSAFKVPLPTKRALKITWVFALLLSCVPWKNTLNAQCNNCVTDVCPPTVNCIPPFTANLDNNGFYPLVPTALVTSFSDNCTTPTLSVVPSFLDCFDVTGAPVLVVVTATDNAGNMASCSIAVTVIDPVPPIISCPNDITIVCSIPGGTSPSNTGYASASDNCGIFPACAPPPFLGLPSGPYPTNCYSDTPIGGPASCSGLTRTWYAYDVNGNSSSCNQTITVEDNVDPILDWNGGNPGTGTPPANQTIDCDDALPAAVSFTATDNCTPQNNISLTTPLSSTKGIDPAQCSYYEYIVTRTYTATDACGNSATYPQVFTVVDDDAPVITCPVTVNVPANINCQGVATIVATVYDNCASNTYLTTAFDVVNNSSGLSVNSGSGLNASGTYQAGIYTVTFSASDPCGNTDFCQTTLNIPDNVAPVALCQLSTVQISLPPTGTVVINPSLLDNGSFDACSPITLSVSPPTVTCANLGFPLLDPYVLTVTDGYGNTNTCTAFISVVDNSAPAMFCQDVTVYLDASGQVTVPATDIDDGSYDACGLSAFEISKDGGATYAPSATFLCPEKGVNNVILKVTDSSGNMGTCPATVTVIDDIDPVAVCTTATVVLNQDGMYKVNLNQATATLTNSTSTPIPNSGSVSSILNFSDIGVITNVKLTNLSISHGYVGNLVFQLKSPSGTIVTVGDQPGVPGTLTGCSEEDILASFDDAAASPKEAFEFMCGNPTAISGNFQPVTPFAVFNGENLSGNWELTINDVVNLLPIFGNDNGTLNSWSLEISYMRFNDLNIGFGSNDNCMFTMSMSPNMFSCADINKDGNPNTGPGGNEGIPYTLTVTDMSGNTATCSSTITVIDNIPPMITCADNVPVLLNANGTYTLQGQEILNGGIYISSGNSGSGTAGTTTHCRTITKPMWLDFDYDFTHTGNSCDEFGYSIGGNYTMLQTSCGSGSVSSSAVTPVMSAGTTFCFVTKTSDNQNGRAEVWVKDLEGFTPGTPTGVVKNIDLNNPAFWTGPTNSANTDGKCFFYDACGLSSLTVTPNAFTCSDIPLSPISVTVTATDPSGNSSQCVGSVIVYDDEPPTVVCEDELTVNLNGLGQAAVPAINFVEFVQDACCTTFVYSVAIIDPLTGNWGTFNPSLNVVCSDIGTFMAVVKVTDCYGNEGICMTQVTVKDKLPPVFVMCPADITVECDDFALGLPVPPPSLTGIAMAQDNCNGLITLPPFVDSNFDPILSGSPQGLYENRDCQKFRRTWTATDSSGNASVCTHIITVVDNVAPVFDPFDFSTMTVECTPPAVVNPTADDQCDPMVDVTLNTNTTKGNNPALCSFYNYDLTRTWTARDNCGNSTQASKIIQVRDTQAPVFTCPTKIVLNNDPGQCSVKEHAGGALNFSGCITDCAAFANLNVGYFVFLDTINPPLNPTSPTYNKFSGADAKGTYPVGVHSIVFQAIDPCGNTSWFYLTLKVKDTESPSPTCYPLTKALTNNGTLQLDPSDIDLGNSDDNCGIVDLTLVPSFFDCNDIGVNQVVLTATDAAGNMNSCTTNVTITLATQPSLLCQNNLTVNCDVSLDPFNPTSPTDPAQVIVNGPCNGLVTPTYVDLTIAGNQPNCRTIQRTWSAAGATCVQIITVVDPQAPVITLPVAMQIPPISFDCSNIPNPASYPATVTDNCVTIAPVTPIVISTTQVVDPADCLHYDYDEVWQWSATDNCNAPTVVTRTVFITDNNPPAFSFPDTLVYPTDPGLCEAQVVLNLLDYISDCVPDQYLTVVNDANFQYGNGNGTTNINGLYQEGYYTITVTAWDVCNNSDTESFVFYVKDTQTPEAVCFTNITIALDNTGVATLDAFTQVDDGSNDNCGLIVDYSLSQDVFTAVGVYPVLMTVTDATGNTNDCPSIITVVDDPTFKAGTVVGQPGTSVLVPITGQLLNDLTSFQFKFTISPALATIQGIQNVHPALSANGTIGIGLGTGIVGWYETPPLAGVDIPDGEILFNLAVMINPGATIPSSADVLIDLPTMEVYQLIGGIETLVPAYATDGKILVNDPMNVHAVSGSLITKADDCTPNAPILSVIVQNNLLLADNLGDGTDPGEFSFMVPNGSDITITPSKNINYQNGTLTANDAFRAHQYALGNDPPSIGLTPLTPLQIVAADANSDNVVTTSDATKIHQLAANANSITLPKSWRFIPKAVADALPAYPFVPGFDEFKTLMNVSADMAGIDFRGIKVGNVVGCENPALLNGGPVSDGDDQLVLVLEDRPLIAGQEITLAFRGENFLDFVTHQFTLKFDQQVLQYVSAEAKALDNSSGLIFSSSDAANGHVGVSWYNLASTSLNKEEELYTMTFTVLQDAEALSQVLSLNNDFIVVEATKSNGAIWDIGLVFEGGATSTNEESAKGFALFQNSPNPFGHKTSIGFRLPQSTHATLTISDATGKVLKVVESDFTAGYHVVHLDRSELRSDGILLYRLDTPTHSAVRKMVLVD